MGLLEFNDRGIYCPKGDFYIDPWRPVKRAVITHAHADHARWGHKYYLAHPLSVPVLRQRLGAGIKVQALEYGEKINLLGTEVSLHPAGHIPGSAQVRVEYQGQIWVVSGDYKLEDDGLCIPFEPVPCQHFITESTFGLPVYRWPEPREELAALRHWWEKNAVEGTVSVVAAYALGKAQRVLQSLEDGPGDIWTHGATENVNAVLRDAGLTLPETRRVEREHGKKDLQGGLVLCPPSALGSTWLRRFQPYRTAFCSGWMALRGARRRRAADRGFVISDHADWPGLNLAVEATGAENVYVTHGYTELFARWLREEKGLNAFPVETLYEGETVEGDV